MHGDLSKKKIEKGRLLKRTSTVAKNNEKHLSRGAFHYFLCETDRTSCLEGIVFFCRRLYKIGDIHVREGNYERIVAILSKVLAIKHPFEHIFLLWD